MNKDQFMKVLSKLQQLQQMTVGETIDFKIDTYRRLDDAASIDFTINRRENYLRGGTITENDKYEASCARIKELADYLRSNKWI